MCFLYSASKTPHLSIMCLAQNSSNPSLTHVSEIVIDSILKRNILFNLELFCNFLLLKVHFTGMLDIQS